MRGFWLLMPFLFVRFILPGFEERGCGAWMGRVSSWAREGRQAVCRPGSDLPNVSSDENLSAAVILAG